MKKLAFVAFLSLGALAALAQTARTPATQGTELYIIAPADNATVTSPVTVRFGLKGMGVAPAGIQLPDTGHHHLLIDADLPPLDKPIPADANHVHFGKGQTETTLTLAPGKHTLQLILGDHLHIPHQPAVVSQKITITVR
jgi:Domain of unknown function (DUF4399)